MNRLKVWIIQKYLPAVARAALEEEIARLNKRNTELAVELREQRAYTNGLQESLRAIRRITINNEVK